MPVPEAFHRKDHGSGGCGQEALFEYGSCCNRPRAQCHVHATYNYYAALPNGQGFDCVQATAEQFRAVSECYAMCRVVGKITTLARLNSCYLGGYRQDLVLLHFLEKELDCDHPNWSCRIVDMVAQTAGQPVNYVVRRLRYMTEIGKETWRRAHWAAVCRFAINICWT